jgi:hypothetical protein
LFFPSKNLFLNLWNKILNKNNNYPAISRSFSNYRIKALMVQPLKNIFKFKFPPYFEPNTLLIKHYVDLFGDTNENESEFLEEMEVTDEEEIEPKTSEKETEPKTSEKEIVIIEKESEPKISEKETEPKISEKEIDPKKNIIHIMFGFGCM